MVIYSNPAEYKITRTTRNKILKPAAGTWLISVKDKMIKTTMETML
jgi:hypothetical protein